MLKFRTLYTYALAKEVEVEESTDSTNEQGEKITVTKTVRKEMPQDYCLQRPTRTLHDEAELFFNVTISQGMQAGLLSAALLAKRFTNDGGVLSEQEKKAWSEKFLLRVKKEVELQKASLADEETRTPEQQTAYEELIKEVAVLSREMQEFEIRQQSMFDITAEARARTRTILWWLLFLLHRKNEKGEWVPFFAGKDVEEKQASYDEYDDEDIYPLESDRRFTADVISKAIKAVTLWYYGRASTQEEFTALLKEVEYAEKQ